jgi:hypothetical protein
MEEKIKKLKLSKKQRAEIRKKVNEWNKDHPLQNKSGYHWMVAKIESDGGKYHYCVRTKFSNSILGESDTARRLATEEHKQLFPNKNISGIDILGYVESFISGEENA